MLSEASRERDLQRYYQPWLDARSLLDADVDVDTHDEEVNALTYKGYKPRSSRDKALTAFAQLAALRLNVKRAMVSLIDSKQQYILAEATQTLSLISDTRHAENDGIWLGNTVLQRAVAVCGHTFGSSYTAYDDEGNSYTAEALVVPDMRLDDRFKHRDYVRAKPGVLFYAGVPIKTKAGHKIGVYAVSSDRPRFGLNIGELRFMQDVAATVMEHLEMAKDRDDRNKGEKMVRGLARFIEGMAVVESIADTVAETRTDPNSLESGNSARTTSTPSSATMARQTENARIEDPDIPTQLPTRSLSNASKPPTSAPSPSQPQQKGEEDVSRIFYRAARIIRESTSADGVVFFGTVAGNIKGNAVPPPNGTQEGSDDSQTSDSGFSSGNGHGSKHTAKAPSLTKVSVGQGDAPAEVNNAAQQNSKLCEVIGLSVDPSSPSSAKIAEQQFGYTEASMERYIKRYPHGKFFSFTDNGSGISSGDERSETEVVEVVSSTAGANSPRNKTKKKNKREIFVPTELLRVLPGIRNMIFLPLWDAISEKWIAGAFIWTSNAGSLMSPENELPYLKAFGNSIMSELARMNAQKSDRAKTTFIASISHELRSPLHGILGSVEFLHDTATTPYQAGLITSVETCGKTLLDTIDHVLDYAKINKLRRSVPRKKNDTLARITNNISTSVLGSAVEFDLSALVEEVVEAVCAGHAFRKSHSGVFLEASTKATADSNLATSPPDAALAVPNAADRVDILLDISPHTGWTVRTQPGALRRIVMNLLGNALKYTPSGFVAVSLQARQADNPSNLDLTLRFVDSGKGMSLEYQRTRLFSPFSQEDPFAVGTGLGLSIVRQIVQSLNGTIDIKSAKGVGTEVEVTLSLPAVADKHNDINEVVKPIAAATKGLKLSVVSVDSRLKYDRIASSLRNTCETWFEMEVKDAASMEEADGDILLVAEGPTDVDDIISAYEATGRITPIIVICHNVARETVLKTNSQRMLATRGLAVEVISQPSGPVKMALVLQKILPYVGSSANRPSLPPAINMPQLPPDEDVQPGVPIPGRFGDRAHQLHQGLQAAAATPALGDPLSALRSPPVLTPTVLDVSAIPMSSTIPPSASNQPGPPSPTQQPSAPTTPHILVVDDNPINLQLLVMFMKKHAYTFASATNGLEAVAAVKATAPSRPSSPTSAAFASSPPSSPSTSTHPLDPASASAHPTAPTAPRTFDFILMDISMPVMDGLEATRQIRRLERERRMRRSTVIALTGLASAQAQEEALGAGVDAYIAKPVKFKELRRMLVGS